ncbi:hypothetical protein BDB01DRAFT_850533 [Pilobolus umbonatus]|nr:hypothetical protein BDB01DRAFT_850533 [Pilobolus umbonatus]
MSNTIVGSVPVVSENSEDETNENSEEVKEVEEVKPSEEEKVEEVEKEEEEIKEEEEEEKEGEGEEEEEEKEVKVEHVKVEHVEEAEDIITDPLRASSSPKEIPAENPEASGLLTAQNLSDETEAAVAVYAVSNVSMPQSFNYEDPPLEKQPKISDDAVHSIEELFPSYIFVDSLAQWELDKNIAHITDKAPAIPSPEREKVQVQVKSPKVEADPPYPSQTVDPLEQWDVDKNIDHSKKLPAKQSVEHEEVKVKSPKVEFDPVQTDIFDTGYSGRSLVSDGVSRADPPPRIDTQSLRRDIVMPRSSSSSLEIIVDALSDLPGEDLLKGELETSEGVDSPIDKTTEKYKRIQRLFLVVNELLETEATYLSDLNVLYKNFFCTFEATPYVTKHERQLLLRNIKDIILFQNQFSIMIKDAHESSILTYKDLRLGNLKALAECFVEKAHEFEVYMEYCVHHDHAMSIYSRLMDTNYRFQDLMKILNNHSSLSFQTKNLHFEDFFAAPFQRLFRYKLLLESISKAIDSEDESYPILIKAQELFHSIAAYINHEKSVLDSKRKTLLFLSRLKSGWNLAEKWFNILGSCKLIGTLDVQYINTNKSKRMGCALFKHYMIITRARSHDAYDPKYWFSLKKCVIKDLTVNGIASLGWKVSNEDNILEFVALCAEEKTIWMDALKENIDLSTVFCSSEESNKDIQLEQLFKSNFDFEDQTRDNVMRRDSVDSRRQYQLVNKRYSQSIIMRKVRQNLNRLSYPLRGIEADYFKSNMMDFLSHRKGGHYQSRCKAVDYKYEDVSTTPLLRARKKFLNEEVSVKTGKRNSSHQKKTNSIILVLEKLMPSLTNPYSSRPPSSSSARSNTDSIIRSGLNKPQMHNNNGITTQPKPPLKEASNSERILIYADNPTVHDTALPTEQDIINELIKNDPSLAEPSSIPKRPSSFSMIGKITERLSSFGSTHSVPSELDEQSPNGNKKKTLRKKKFFPDFFRSNERKK